MTTRHYLKLFLALTLVLAGCTTPSENDDSDLTDEIIASDEEGAAASNSDEVDDFDEEFATNEEAQEEQSLNPEEQQPPEQSANEEPQPQPEAAPEPQPEQVAEQAPPPEPAPVPAPVAAPSNRVTAINYLDSKNGGAVEVITDKVSNYHLRPSTNANQYVLEIQDATLSESLKRPYIMKDFSGAFGTINAYQNPGGQTARIVIQLKGSGEPIVTQEGNTLLVTAPTLAENLQIAKTEAKELDHDKASYNTKEAKDNEKILGARTLDEFLTGSGRFFGRPISIQVNGADIRDVISFIAEESGVNLVIADDVEGKVSLKLRQVPWDQALVIVMRSKGLGYVRQGNVLRITKLLTLQAEAEAAKKIVDSQKNLEPLKVKVMPVSYAGVEELEKQIKSFLSERGKVVSDTRTSSVIITDTIDTILRVERLVKELDIPPAQVMIEGKIIEATEVFTRNLGVNWNMTGSPTEISAAGGRNGSPINLTPGLRVQNLSADKAAAANGFFSLNIGSLDLFGNLNATLSLAQADNLVRIISSPRVVTMNKEKAIISQQGESISIQTVTDEKGNKLVSSKSTPLELKLEVTPQITAEGSVVLDMFLKRQFAGAESNPETKQKPTNTREAKTKVLVQNGQTAVIGGIYQSDELESESGVPGLKNIPVLGWLFKQKSSEKTKNELLLFVTPRILNAKDQAVKTE